MNANNSNFMFMYLKKIILLQVKIINIYFLISETANIVIESIGTIIIEY